MSNFMSEYLLKYDRIYGWLSKIASNEPYCLITTGAKQTLQLIIKARAERIMGALQPAAIFELSTFPFSVC